MALRGRLGRRRGGHGERPQQGRRGDDDTHELAQGGSLPVGCTLWPYRQERVIGQGAASREPAKRSSLPVCASTTSPPTAGPPAPPGPKGPPGPRGGGGRGSGRPDPPGSATVGCCWSWSPWPRSSPWSTSRRSWATAAPAEHLPEPAAADGHHRAPARRRPAPAGHGVRRRAAGDGRPRPPEPPASPTGRGLGAAPGRRRDAGRPEPGWVGAGRARCWWVGVAGRVPAAGDDDAGDGAAAGVRVPPVAVRVRPPALLGRDLPEVRVATPEVKLDTALP